MAKDDHVTSSDVGALTLRGFVAPWVLDGAIVMHNLSSHKGPNVREMIEAAVAELRYLPPYSPDFNPIEMVFAKLKALLRKAEERTVDGLWRAISRLIDLFRTDECGNYFAAAGYDAN